MPWGGTCQVQPGGYPAGGVPWQGVPWWGGTLAGGYRAGGVPCRGGTLLGAYPSRGVPYLGTPQPGQDGGGTQLGQQKEYSLHGGRYASCVHAGGLSCIYFNFIFQCSHDGCNTPNVHSGESVEQFVERYRSNLKNNETFQCYFDSKNPSIVLEGIKYGQTSALHSFLWPLCFMVMFFTLFCIFGSVTKRGDKKTKEPHVMPDILLNLKERVEI